MRVYWDSEFSGLHQATTLISIGCVAENGAQFYAEFTDFDPAQIDDWIAENVIGHLWSKKNAQPPSQLWEVLVADRATIAEALRVWLWAQVVEDVLDHPDAFPTVEMWGDCLAYDWVLFCELFGGAFAVPTFVYYIPFDLATLLKVKGLDPDISREEYSGLAGGTKHNALWDAQVIQACYAKAMQVTA